MARRKKLKECDTKPLETAKEVVEKVIDDISNLKRFCLLNDVTLIVGVSCYDKLTTKESRKFLFIGPDSSVAGLSMFLSEEVSIERGEPEFEDD